MNKCYPLIHISIHLKTETLRNLNSKSYARFYRIVVHEMIEACKPWRYFLFRSSILTQLNHKFLNLLLESTRIASLTQTHYLTYTPTRPDFTSLTLPLDTFRHTSSSSHTVSIIDTFTITHTPTFTITHLHLPSLSHIHLPSLSHIHLPSLSHTYTYLHYHTHTE